MGVNSDDKTLMILRSVSGAGKTTLASLLEKDLHYAVSYAADDYFYEDTANREGAYNFDHKLLGEAHSWCKERVNIAMECGMSYIIVHNTNTTEKEIKPYLDLAGKYGYKVVSLVIENRHGSDDVHNVPNEVKKKQEQRLRGSLKLL